MVAEGNTIFMILCRSEASLKSTAKAVTSGQNHYSTPRGKFYGSVPTNLPA